MKKALEGQFEVHLIRDKKENALRRVYRSLGSSLLPHKWMWEQAGERIAKVILSEKPDAAILVTDVTAGAIPFLKKEGILTVLSIEDLSAEWLKIANEKAIYQILQSYATLSDAVIAVSGKLQQKLFDIGIEAKVVRPGLEKIFVSPQEAIEREKGPQILLHSGQIQFEEEKNGI